jgi:hypothetical protein
MFMKMKKFLSYFLAFAISAAVLSISLYASVELRDDAPTTAMVNVGDTLTYTYGEIEGWFDLVPSLATGDLYQDSYIESINISVSPTTADPFSASLNSGSKESFTFEPVLADAGESYTFTFTVKGNNDGDTESHDVVVTVTADQEPMPEATIDFVNAMLIGLENEEYYTINSESKESDVNGKIQIDSAWFGETISIIKNGDGSLTVASEPQELYIPVRPELSVTGVMASAAGNDGKIIGLDPTKVYRYSINAYVGEYQDVTEITGLEPGTYRVYMKAVADESFASMEADVVVPEYPASVNFGLVLPVGLGSLTYNDYQIPENTPDPILGGGSYNYDSDSSTLTFNNVSFTTSNRIALRLHDGPITLNINGTNLLKSTNPDDGNAVSGAAVTITGTGSLTAEHARGPAFGDTLTIAMTDYTYESVDDKIVIITYKAPAPAPVIPEKEPAPVNTPYDNPAPPSPPVILTFDGGTISLPYNNQSIKKEVRFNSKRTAQTEAYVLEKWGADVLVSFETRQKGGWGATATITISLEKLGFELEDGTKLYVLIFDTKTKKWYQVEAIIENGNIVIVTEWSGVFAIVNEKVL